MPVNTFVKMLIRVEGLPTKATNNGPPRTKMIHNILIRVLILRVCKIIKAVDTSVNYFKLAYEKGQYKPMLNYFAMYKK